MIHLFWFYVSCFRKKCPQCSSEFKHIAYPSVSWTCEPKLQYAKVVRIELEYLLLPLAILIPLLNLFWIANEPDILRGLYYWYVGMYSLFLCLTLFYMPLRRRFPLHDLFLVLTSLLLQILVGGFLMLPRVDLSMKFNIHLFLFILSCNQLLYLFYYAHRGARAYFWIHFYIDLWDITPEAFTIF